MNNNQLMEKIHLQQDKIYNLESQLNEWEKELKVNKHMQINKLNEKVERYEADIKQLKVFIE